MGSSPHTRGAPRAADAQRAPLGIIPAYAGSTPSPSTRRTTGRDHPRIRGEHLTELSALLTASGSSPHTRGAQRVRAAARVVRGIIPAYAGSTATPSTSGSATWDHPRIRGEHDEVVFYDTGAEGSSPHTRGAREYLGWWSNDEGIIPAYAGSTHRVAAWLSRARDHPRIRGEHAVSPSDSATLAGSSPHTRGAPSVSARFCSISRIIPAYAGSTRRTPRRPLCTRDHPRIRGEHALLPLLGSATPGSSPHTRGAPVLRYQKAADSGIIPAYAGSTPTTTA